MKSTISPEPALLGFLHRGPLHGYDLHKQVVSNLGGVWRVGMSQMYALLKDYEAHGWITTITAPQQTGRPARKMLKLTPQGERAFEAWMKQTARGLREFRVDFFARLYFARAAGRPALQAFLDHQLKSTRQEYDALQTTTASSEFNESVISFRRAQLQAILDWLAAYRASESKRTAPRRVAPLQPKRK